MDNSNDLSRRFLDSFNAIEQRLKDYLKANHHMSFLEMLRRASKDNGVVKRYAIDLREFAELRNAIIHSRRDNFVIAEPHLDIVEEIKRIEELMYHPPLVSSLELNRPYIATPATLLSDVLRTFAQRDFMRCPVILHGKIHALISAKTITKFLANRMDGNCDISRVIVNDILKYSAEEDFEMVGQSSSLFDVYDVFKRRLRSGNNLQAVVVTDNGNTSGRILGIITPSDLPHLFEILGP